MVPKTQRKQGLTVTLATFNEEAVLARCLKAVQALRPDQIIIVDGSSSDKTRQIAQEFGARVYKTTNKPNFHINKKAANQKAQTPWILQLDADEFVTKQLVEEIRRLLEGKDFGWSGWQSPLKRRLHRWLPFLFQPPQRLTAPAAAYYLPRKNFFLGSYLRHTGQYPDPVIRLFQRSKAYLPAKDVHEQMVVDGPVGWLRGDLDHWATPVFSRYILRENRYSSFAANQLRKQGVKPRLTIFLQYVFWKPLTTFFSLFIRYQGFADGFPGFVFSLFSALHFVLTYLKLWEIHDQTAH